MPSFRLTPNALADLLDIGRYTERQWGRNQRNAYLATLNQAFDLLSQNPLLGQDRTDLRTGLRGFVCRSHIIFYRIDNEIVVILRVLHLRRDPTLSGLN